MLHVYSDRENVRLLFCRGIVSNLSYIRNGTNSIITLISERI